MMAIYGRGFVAGILAGFEEALEVLLAGVDEDARKELCVLSGHIERTRLQLDLGTAMEDNTESQREGAESVGEVRSDSNPVTPGALPGEDLHAPAS
jgi:hypothetical protein